MHPKLRIFLLRTVTLAMKLLYVVILLLTCATTAIGISSPIVLTYLVVLNKLGKAVTILNGDYLYLWLCVTAVFFIPILLYSIIYRIRQKIRLSRAVEQAKAQKEKEKAKESK